MHVVEIVMKSNSMNHYFTWIGFLENLRESYFIYYSKSMNHPH